MLTLDTIYTWVGFGNGFGRWNSHCRLRIYKHQGKTVVVVSDRGNGSGTSITNCAEHLATLVVRDRAINPSNLVWIEHYPGQNRTFKESFDLVKFFVRKAEECFESRKYPGAAWIFSSPHWTHLGREKTEHLTGTAVNV